MDRTALSAYKRCQVSNTIPELEATIADRRDHPREGSYTCRLFAQGEAEILKKLGEEAVEVIVAAALQDRQRVVYEGADLIYHLLVALAAKEITWQEIEDELRRRFK
jgi:phosphoribosyl-ATP pyrophosphohydrolase